MPEWLLYALAAALYLAGWLLTVWILTRRAGEDPDAAGLLALFWPGILLSVIFLSPVLLAELVWERRRRQDDPEGPDREKPS